MHILTVEKAKNQILFCFPPQKYDPNVTKKMNSIKLFPVFEHTKKLKCYRSFQILLPKRND